MISEETAATQTASEKPAKKARAGAQRANVASKKGKSAKKASTAKKAPKAAKKADGARDGSKTAKVLELLKRDGGVTAKELLKATGWQAHSVRGFLSGTVGKKMGLTVVSTKALLLPLDWLNSTPLRPVRTAVSSIVPVAVGVTTIVTVACPLAGTLAKLAVRVRDGAS